MKKITTLLTITLIGCLIYSCGGKKTGSETNEGEPTIESEEVDVQDPGAKLIAESDCLTCHKETVKLIGPSYVEVAGKYSEKDIDMLAGKIINGGSGVFGETPMTPHPSVSMDDARTMVKYILSLN